MLYQSMVHALPPKPQGPFIIKANGNTSIPFKNVFNSALQFTFAIDNHLFHVKSTEVIKSNQTHKIFVSFHGNDSPTKADVMAKLIVTPAKSSRSKHKCTMDLLFKGCYFISKHFSNKTNSILTIILM